MRNPQKTNNAYAWVYFSYMWGFLFVAIPCFIIFLFCFLDTQHIGFQYHAPYYFENKATIYIKIHLQNIIDIFSSPFYLHAYIDSIIIAFFSATGCLIVTYPLMYMAWQIPKRWRFFLLGGVLLPYVTSCMIRLYALKNLLAPQNWLAQLILPPNKSLVYEIIPSDSYIALIAGTVYVYSLFMAYPIYLSLMKIPHNLIEAGSDLGARPSDVLKSIVFPLSIPGIETGFKIVFLASFCDCVISDFFGNDTMPLWGRIIYQTFLVERNWPKACVLAVLSMTAYIFPLLLFTCINYYVKNFPVEEVVEH